jgi:hypothetical protein
MKITRRQLRIIIQEQVAREVQSQLRYAIVDYVDATGLNPGDPMDNKRIHNDIDRIVDMILGN